jgi:branched-subunit amino acid aminotransferase/4-amino-4-deoxychorismate lyase
MIGFSNGKFLDFSEIKLAINDLGVLRALAVFDFIYARGDRLFLPKEHFQRFKRSAKTLGLKVPYDFQKSIDLTTKILRKNRQKESIIRWLLTGGVTSGLLVEEPTFAIINESYKQYPSTLYRRGAKAITVDFSREIFQAKTTNYQIAYKNYPKMLRAGAIELIYINQNNVLEGATSNLFIIKNGQVLTAKEGVLSGITGNLALKLFKKRKIEVSLKTISSKELLSADEVFITATNKKIMPIVKIDQRSIADGVPGPITRKLIADFSDFEEGYFNSGS